MIDPKLEQKMNRIAEEMFGSLADQDQIPITRESSQKLNSLSEHWVKYSLDETGAPIAFVAVVPTTKDIANLFLRGQITERQILDATEPQLQYSALYLASAITLSNYRRQCLATQLMHEAVQAVPKTADCLYFAWAYSEEGKKLLEKLQSSGINISVRCKRV